MAKETIRDLILWISVLAGPAFWLLSFQAKFSWTQWACASQTKAGLFVFAFIALVLTAGAGIMAWRQWKQLGAQPTGEAGSALARSRFMALGGMAFSIGFFLVIVAQTVPDVILEVCQ